MNKMQRAKHKAFMFAYKRFASDMSYRTAKNIFKKVWREVLEEKGLKEKHVACNSFMTSLKTEKEFHERNDKNQ